jgi:glutathione S-transferase
MPPAQPSRLPRLFYSVGSPYARICRMALREGGLAARAQEVATTLRDPSAPVLSHSPVGRVPALVLEDGITLTETTLVLGWLDRLGSRPTHERSPSVIALEVVRAGRIADALEHAVKAGAYATVDAGFLALAAVLGYAERRHTVWAWREGRPSLEEWFAHASRRAAFRETVPPISGI